MNIYIVKLNMSESNNDDQQKLIHQYLKSINSLQRRNTTKNSNISSLQANISSLQDNSLQRRNTTKNSNIEDPDAIYSNIDDSYVTSLIGKAGADISVLQLLPQQIIQVYNIKQCAMCTKFYLNDMITKYDDFGICCWHCIFGINYDMEARGNVDGKYGKTISEYIHDCEKSHIQNNCIRKEGCFLCDYKNGKEIKYIKNSHLVNSNQKKEISDEEIFTKESEYTLNISI